MRESQGAPLGNQFPWKVYSHFFLFLLEVSRAPCQECGAMKWVQLLGSGRSILIAKREKKLLHIFCNN